MKSNVKVTLIIPCYNEETNIQKGVLDKIGNYTNSNHTFGEVLIVDDGSTDQSKSIVKEKYLPNFPKFRLIENRHLGKAGAVISGITHAKETYAMFSDIDLATPLEESEKLIEEVGQGYDIVIGSRNSSRDGAPLFRKIMARGFIVVRDILIGLQGIRDTQCGFKIFAKGKALLIIKKLKVSNQDHTVKGSSVNAAFDLEFLFLAQKMGYKIKEVPVVWKHVETKNVNFFHDSIETFKDILKIKYYDITQKYT
ncbi:MAG: glycosyltransferase [bacterium]|nr:glycosyltransferase [bacterium]